MKGGAGMRPNLHFHHMDLNLPNPLELKCTSRVKKWAYDNAWTLLLMAVLFLITWVWILYLGVRNSVS